MIWERIKKKTFFHSLAGKIVHCATRGENELFQAMCSTNCRKLEKKRKVRKRCGRQGKVCIKFAFPQP